MTRRLAFLALVATLSLPVLSRAQNDAHTTYSRLGPMSTDYCVQQPNGQVAFGRIKQSEANWRDTVFETVSASAIRDPLEAEYAALTQEERQIKKDLLTADTQAAKKLKRRLRQVRQRKAAIDTTLSAMDDCENGIMPSQGWFPVQAFLYKFTPNTGDMKGVEMGFLFDAVYWNPPLKYRALGKQQTAWHGDPWCIQLTDASPYEEPVTVTADPCETRQDILQRYFLTPASCADFWNGGTGVLLSAITGSVQLGIEQEFESWKNSAAQAHVALRPLSGGPPCYDGTVHKSAPVVKFSWQQSASDPLTFIFDASASYDADGTITSYDWRFSPVGSGSYAQVGPGPDLVRVTHTFEAEGEYEAYLRLFDNDGFEKALTKTVVVGPPTFTWSVPDRFGKDVDGDGLIDYPTAADDVQLQAYPVDFEVVGPGGIPCTPAMQYEFKADGQPLVTQQDGCTFHALFPAEGTYRVAMYVNRKKAVTQDVLVQDWLIVVMGDSMASGEGNPDKALSPDGLAAWEDNTCHRSSLSGAAQAALELEQSDDKTSVTFVDLSCSGARISEGLLGYQRNPRWQNLGKHLPPQIAQVAQLVGKREIDALILTGGANDLGFGSTAFFCALNDDCPWRYFNRRRRSVHRYSGVEVPDGARIAKGIAAIPLHKGDRGVVILRGDPDYVWVDGEEIVLQLTKDGGWRETHRLVDTVGSAPVLVLDTPVQHDAGILDLAPVGVIGYPPSLDDVIQERLADLPRTYDQLAGQLAALPGLVDPARIYALEYFDPTADETGKTCTRILSSGLAGHLGLGSKEGISRTELDWAKERFVDGLNGAIAGAAARHGWSVVTGIAAGFRSHGYCASGDSRWILQLEDSFGMQGDASGTLHPNADGHLFIATLIGDALTRDLYPNGDTRLPVDPEGKTTLTKPSAAGDQVLHAAVTDGFSVGDEITVNPGGSNEEIAHVAGFGSILLAEPLVFDHVPGETVRKRPHDLSVRSLVVPAVVEMAGSATTVDAVVTIQNQSPHQETIPDAAALDALARLTAQSLGSCPDPVVRRTGPMQFPIVLRPHDEVDLSYRATLDCVNDPLRARKHDPGHEDYQWAVVLDHVALDGVPDDDPLDDVCPHAVVPPYRTDPNPDGSILDPGCGGQAPGQTFGSPVMTDLVTDFTPPPWGTTTTVTSTTSTIPALPGTCADPSGDGNVQASDALLVLRSALGLVPCDACVCDVDGDGSITASDALRVLKVAVGFPVALLCVPCL